MSKSFHNENWFPLSEKDMEEAAIDTALEQISAKGVLAFVPAGKGEGKLDLSVTLVEPASLVKLTIQLNAEGRPSAVATASTSVSKLDHEGIYYAFEHVGREAAERFNARLVYLNTATPQARAAQAGPARQPPPEPRPAGQDPSPPRSCDDTVLKGLTAGDRHQWQTRAIYLRGQELKEKFCYFDARVAFESAAADERPENASWRQLAQNELIYGLPLFEARQLSIRLSPLMKDESRRWSHISDYLRHIELLYRQILVENESNVDRVIATQGELDNFHVTWEALKGSVEYAADRDVDWLVRSIRADVARHGGELPHSVEDCQLRLATALRPYEVLEYGEVRAKGEATLRVRHRRWGSEWGIVFNEDLDVKSRRLH